MGKRLYALAVPLTMFATNWKMGAIGSVYLRFL
jgi:hypothetical protein